MSLRNALAQSINIPAVKTLYLAGIPNVISLANAVGITTLSDPKQYGLSFALGAAEVKLLDLTSAYGTFANDGIRHKPTGILSVTDTTGKVLEEYKDDPIQAISPDVAHQMSSMLSNNEARFPEYSAQNPLHFDGYDVAAKTGTTNDYRDVWTVGYSPNIVIGAWAGNNDNRPMVKEIAGYVVAPMWHEVMSYALTKHQQSYFAEPPGIPESVPAALRGFSGGHDILYWVDKNNPQGGGSSQGDGQFARWEYSIYSWAPQVPLGTPDSTVGSSTTVQTPTQATP